MKWVYKKNYNNSARYVLGKIENRSGRTILCLGINPSTAEPNNLDNTLKKVNKISHYNGYDNWIMLNIYPQRATDIDAIDIEPNRRLLKRNFRHITKILNKYKNSDIWLAYGNLISKRKYLRDSLEKILDLFNKHNKVMKITGNTKLNNPVHPLYQPDNAILY